MASEVQDTAFGLCFEDRDPDEDAHIPAFCYPNGKPVADRITCADGYSWTVITNPDAAGLRRPVLNAVTYPNRRRESNPSTVVQWWHLLGK